MHGMFDKDKEFGRSLSATFDKNEEFLLHDAAITNDNVQTSIGRARQTTLTVSRLDREQNIRFQVTTLGSAIADKANEAGAGDFPAVVCWTEVDSKNYGNSAVVVQWVRDPSEDEVARVGA